MSARGATAVLAGLVLLVGVILGFAWSSTIHDPTLGAIHCGAPFAPSNDAKDADVGVGLVGVTSDFQAQCSSNLGGARLAAFSLTGVGLLALLFCGLTASVAQKPQTSVRETDSDPAA